MTERKPENDRETEKDNARETERENDRETGKKYCTYYKKQISISPKRSDGLISYCSQIIKVSERKREIFLMGVDMKTVSLL